VATDYVYAFWTLLFLGPWISLFVGLPDQRRPMLWASLFTAPLGLSEPLFVPEYWNPPTLFHLAATTGFDIESIIFAFAVGGVAAVLHNIVTHSPLGPVGVAERGHRRHRFHRLALAAPFIAFVPLWLLPWSVIYASSAALLVGAAATVACRPDLARKTLIGSVLFFGYYALFFATLTWLTPGYVERVWNLDALTGVRVIGIPLEELLFAAALGACWAGLYEHVHWLRTRSNAT